MNFADIHTIIGVREDVDNVLAYLNNFLAAILRRKLDIAAHVVP